MKILVLILALTQLLSHSASAGCLRGATHSALMIIDMQPIYIWRSGFEKLPGNVEKVTQLFEAQQQALIEAMKRGWPVVFVTYEDQGPVDPRLTELVRGYERVTFLTKDVDGLFSNSNRYLRNAESFLEKNEIGRLVIMGANGGACVKQTIEGALDGQKCAVDAYTPGIADFNQSEFIYPYAGYYLKMLNWCLGCLLKESFRISDL